MAVSVPSLNWLRVFEAAARAESFARAASELNMSAAAVSQQVRALEERLETRLFERQAHAVRLTEAGRAYLPGVQQALLTLQSTTEGLFGANRAEQLYVRAVLLFAHGILAEGHGDFSAQHPQITLQIDTGNSIGDFSQGFSDLQIVFGNPSAYCAQGDALFSERLYPVALPEIAAQITSPGDLLRQTLIEVGTHRAGWPHVFESSGIWPGAVKYIFADSTIMAFALARSGTGVALARAPASDRSMAEAGLVPCLEGFSVAGQEAYHLVYPDRAALRPAARRFREWLVAYCAERS
ncbi:LysR family transcriptional regulator [Roseovarius rhodophyticola]|uniref:LysR family transcriptional regulator n=1 Tax=Roseovarius rhodophyticola TaxID=3080827 RepID=A0ABZ2TH40_9RHOB|nr:LysR family transcriptional regulator [Roseovarius sp. W115]MDV2929275.1 LysR family transcriptional regulator [Roseovarius sp. W115]